MLRKASRGRLGLVLLLLILLPLIAALVLRKDIVAWALEAALEAQGFEVVSTEVTELGLARSSIRGLSMAAPGIAVELAAVDLDYSVANLIAGDLPSVNLFGLKLELDPDSPWLKAQMADRHGEALAPATSPDPSESLPAFPEVTIEEAQIRLLTPIGPLELGLEGAVWRDPTGALIGAFSVIARAEQGETAAVVGVTVTSDRNLLADVVIEEGNLDIGGLAVRGLSGSLAAAFDGQENRIERLQSDLAVLRISGALSPDTSLAPTRLSLKALLEEQDIVFTVDAASADPMEEGFLAEVSGRISPVAEATRFSVSSNLETAAALPVFSKFPLPLPETGRLTASAEAELLLPPFAELLAVNPPTTPEDVIQVISSFESRYSLRAEALSHPDFVEGLTAGLEGRATLDKEGLELHFVEPGRVHLTAVSPKLLDQFALTGDLRKWVKSPLELVLSSLEDGPWLRATRPELVTGLYRVAANVDLSGEGLTLTSAVSGELVPVQGTWSLNGPLELQARALPLRSVTGVAGRTVTGLVGRFASTAAATSLEADLNATAKTLKKDDLRLSGVTVKLPLRAELSGQKLRVVTEDRGRVDVKSVSAPAAKSMGPLQLQLLSADIDVDLATASARPDITAALAPAQFSLGGDQETVLLETAVVNLAISPHKKDQGKLAIFAETQSVALPDLQLRAADIAVRITADPKTGALKGRYSGLKLEDLAEARRFEEVSLTGSFQRSKAGRIDFAGEGSSFQDAITFAVKGKSDSRGSSADITLPAHDFDAKPLLINGLSWISEAEVDRGALSGMIHVEMSPEGLEGYARLKSDGMAGQILGFPFSDLSITADLDNLWPPQASSPIRIDLADFNPGLPVSSLHVEAVMLESAPFAVDLRDAALTVLGTQFSLQGGRLALLEGTADLPIRITGLDLAEILKQADLADVEVSGRLTGDLPINFSDGKVTVRPSKLAATEPGVLRVRSEEVNSLLTGYGDEVNSLVRALEDFHYDDLSLTLEKTAEDDLTLLLSILGNNPAVLEGQPFRLNLNLESNIGQILNTLGESLEITKDLLSGRYSFQ